MSVSNGQAASADIFNASFVSKTTASTMTAALALNDGLSNPISNTQTSLNSVISANSSLETRVTALETLETVADHVSDTTPHATISGASIESPTRADVKKDTKSNLEIYAATATNGQLCFATDEKLMYQIVDGALTEVGGGGGGTFVVYAEETVSTVVSSSIDGERQLRPVKGNAGPVSLNSAPFGSFSWTDGTEITLVGTDSTNTVTVIYADSAGGCLLNGNCVLSKGSTLELVFINALSRWIEKGRNSL